MLCFVKYLGSQKWNFKLNIQFAIVEYIILIKCLFLKYFCLSDSAVIQVLIYRTVICLWIHCWFWGFILHRNMRSYVDSKWKYIFQWVLNWLVGENHEILEKWDPMHNYSYKNFEHPRSLFYKGIGTEEKLKKNSRKFHI